MAGDLRDNRGRGDAEWRWPAIHPEGRKFGLIGVGIALIVLLLFDWEIIGWPLLALAGGVFAFFRDPERVVPQDDDMIVAPADGLVTLISQVPPPLELQGPDGDGAPGLGSDPVTRISIFMSVFDVHINRAPVGGTVKRIVYIPGRFMNADLDKASEENERQHILIERPDGRPIGCTQIAGLVARRIVSFVKQGDIVAAGQRIGLIRFGSRVDVYLPQGTDAKVLLGQKIIAGETVLAELGKLKLIEGVSQ
ncbi:phosphatidylserine decarboxylase [Altererythrobacter atlanticus]|uniref:Phosphatidylserine decarboxylase proenzyme n=1 Tax=Croceibacterium atlanticum TaxID=1267766 RepID=A0A0F7KQQ9_9SPHN|nr:phosphatidylserine decarboxylase [Croceibacterium atlanticum]AKH41894.1 phosphatidylserine decarboxylase [Croceibacterium atlanticum]MBB5733543.1 phosphatidylserine decarboxylase [Croceibacterium atlanticum]